MATTGPILLETMSPSNDTVLFDEECLKERKWWCFLLSSIFTFLMGVLSVVVVRAFVSVCCNRDEDEYSQVSGIARGLIEYSRLFH